MHFCLSEWPLYEFLKVFCILFQSLYQFIISVVQRTRSERCDSFKSNSCIICFQFCFFCFALGGKLSAELEASVV